MFPLAEELKQYLLDNVPSAKVVSGGDTIVCRCPYCGDSHKHSKSAHFYISLPTENKPGLYYCHLCHSSGIFTQRTLMDLECFHPDIANDICEHNNYIRENTNYHTNSKSKYYRRPLSYNYIRNDTISYIKLDYINGRLGTNLGFEDCAKLKIIPNLLDLLNSNHMKEYTRDTRIMYQLDDNFVGFLSADNGYVILRKINNTPVYDNINKRYVNYKIFDDYDSASKFYVMPQAIDLSNPNRIKLHIAEGIFDILSIYFNVTNQEPGIYAAVCGSNYSSIISYFLSDMMIPNLEVHLYPDADQDDNKMNKIVRDYDSMRMPIYIHRNMEEGQKDFGVPPKFIKCGTRKANEWV